MPTQNIETEKNTSKVFRERWGLFFFKKCQHLGNNLVYFKKISLLFFMWDKNKNQKLSFQIFSRNDFIIIYNLCVDYFLLKGHVSSEIAHNRFQLLNSATISLFFIICCVFSLVDYLPYKIFTWSQPVFIFLRT